MNKFTAAVLAPVIALFIGSPALAADTAATKRLDINTATSDQLRTTLGVSDEAAEKIISARPYYKKDELKTKNVLPADEFAKIQKLIDSVC